MAEEAGGGITDEQRAEVIRLLFQLMRNNGEDIADDTEVFRYKFIGELGKITIDFEPGKGLVDWAFRTSHGLMLDMLEAAADKLISEGKLDGKPEREVMAEVQDGEVMAAFFAFLAMEGMKGKLRSAIYELGLETERVFEGIILSAMKESKFPEKTGYELPKIAERVKELSKDIADERKRFLTEQINRLVRKPRFERLPELYPMLLKVWQSAKKIYAQNGESETWREMVRAKYPELTFDDDLLTRVTGKLEDLPEDIQAKLAETDGDHTPNTIALEHAARMCGATDYQYGTRYYHKLKSGKEKTELTEPE